MVVVVVVVMIMICGDLKGTNSFEKIKQIIITYQLRWWWWWWW